MVLAACLLLVIGALGAFDIAYFHWYRCRLGERPESRTEVVLHVCRGFVYAGQFVVVSGLELGGGWFAALVALYAADVAIALADVAVEPASRAGQGGLPRGEYVMHIVLSIAVGIYLHAVARATWGWWGRPTAVAFVPVALPGALRALLWVMAAGSALVASLEALGLWLRVDAARAALEWARSVGRRITAPAPLHVSVRLATSVDALWKLTQDHVLHPVWDHRFSRIVMLDQRIERGTRMRYERRLFGMTISGHGRYKHHLPMKQSTFEFWSDDPRSLIRRGVGLWRYKPQVDGTVELATSYTYDVRWGIVGRVVDALVLRPFMQRETERSFRRLAVWFFPEGASAVAGAAGRKPSRLSSLSPRDRDGTRSV